MDDDAKRVEELIREAFCGVVLGKGVGLFQGQAIDDYGDEEKPRSRDEKDDWSRIPASDLDQCYSSLSFFDAEGMRFHLPAYLIATLHSELVTADIVWHLTHSSDLTQSQFMLLSSQQRYVIREFLIYHLSRLDQVGKEFASPAIQQSLETTWNDL